MFSWPNRLGNSCQGTTDSLLVLKPLKQAREALSILIAIGRLQILAQPVLKNCQYLVAGNIMMKHV